MQRLVSKFWQLKGLSCESLQLLESLGTFCWQSKTSLPVDGSSNSRRHSSQSLVLPMIQNRIGNAQSKHPCEFWTRTPKISSISAFGQRLSSRWDMLIPAAVAGFSPSPPNWEASRRSGSDASNLWTLPGGAPEFANLDYNQDLGLSEHEVYHGISSKWPV